MEHSVERSDAATETGRRYSEAFSDKENSAIAVDREINREFRSSVFAMLIAGTILAVLAVYFFVGISWTEGILRSLVQAVAHVDIGLLLSFSGGALALIALLNVSLSVAPIEVDGDDQNLQSAIRENDWRRKLRGISIIAGSCTVFSAETSIAAVFVRRFDNYSSELLSASVIPAFACVLVGVLSVLLAASVSSEVSREGARVSNKARRIDEAGMVEHRASLCGVDVYEVKRDSWRRLAGEFLVRISLVGGMTSALFVCVTGLIGIARDTFNWSKYLSWPLAMMVLISAASTAVAFYFSVQRMSNWRSGSGTLRNRFTIVARFLLVIVVAGLMFLSFFSASAPGRGVSVIVLVLMSLVFTCWILFGFLAVWLAEWFVVRVAAKETVRPGRSSGSDSGDVGGKGARTNSALRWFYRPARNIIGSNLSTSYASLVE